MCLAKNKKTKSHAAFWSFEPCPLSQLELYSRHFGFRCMAISGFGMSVGLHGIGVRQLLYLSFIGSLFWIFRILMHDFLWIARDRLARAFVPSHFPRLGLYSGYFGIRCMTFSGFGGSSKKIARDRFTVLLLTNWGFILYISKFDAWLFSGFGMSGRKLVRDRFARAFVPCHFPRLGLYSGYFGIRYMTFSGFGMSSRKIARDRFARALLYLVIFPKFYSRYFGIRCWQAVSYFDDFKCPVEILYRIDLCELLYLLLFPNCSGNFGFRCMTNLWT